MSEVDINLLFRHRDSKNHLCSRCCNVRQLSEGVVVFRNRNAVLDSDNRKSHCVEQTRRIEALARRVACRCQPGELRSTPNSSQSRLMSSD